MSLPPFFLDPFGRDDLEYNILRKVREEKRECSYKALKKLTKKHIRKGDTLCTLDLVRDSLISKGVTEGRCEYSKNDFSERLNIHLQQLWYSRRYIRTRSSEVSSSVSGKAPGA